MMHNVCISSFLMLLLAVILNLPAKIIMLPQRLFCCPLPTKVILVALAVLSGSLLFMTES